jgi:magnesium transporter
MALPNARMILGSAQRLLRMGATANLVNLLAKQRPVDVAQLLARLPEQQARAAFDNLLSAHRAHALEALSELDVSTAASFLVGRSTEDVAALLRQMAPDDSAAILAELPTELSDQVVEALGHTADVRRLLDYADRTAGRIMTPNVFSLHESVTAGEAVAMLQGLSRPEVVFYLYVVDDRNHLLGVISLRKLVLVRADTPLRQIMTTDVLFVQEDADQEDVARLVATYNMLAVPVVDAEHRLVGVITVDDVIDVIRDETTKDIQKIGGLEALDEPYIQTPFWTLVQKRGRWLVVLFLGELLTATAMGHFQGEIEQAFVLALFVPLILSSGGNSGSQAASLMIRALAVGEVTLADWWSILRREFQSGLALGAVLGTVGFIRVTVWETLFHTYGPHWLIVAGIVGLALIGVVLWATLAGAMLPFILKRLGADPAASSTPFVATLVDVTGLVIYFSVAATLGRGTLL